MPEIIKKRLLLRKLLLPLIRDIPLILIYVGLGSRNTAFLSTLFHRVERAVAYAQGKGFGGPNIEHEVTLVYKALDSTPVLAIDIGGNKGDYTAELRKSEPDLEIHTFEPSATNIQLLNSRFSTDERIVICPYAVSNTTQRASLFSDSPGSTKASLTQRRLDHFDIEFETKEIVETLRFEDYWVERLNKRPIDFVKLDIEGHEMSALDGFGIALEAIKLFQFEFGGCNIDTQTYFQDFWYFFQGNGFDLYRMSPFGLIRITKYQESHEFFSTTNYLAKNNRIID